MLVTLDFETYYDKDCNLRKLTTTEYVAYPSFKVWGVGIKINNKKTKWYGEKKAALALEKIKWQDVSLVCHNTRFDAYILSQIFGHRPRYYYDTMSMSRAVFPDESASLAELSIRLFPEDPSLRKGEDLVQAKGIETLDKEMDTIIGNYCIQDVELTKLCFDELMLNFPISERDLINMTIRMFVEPTLKVDTIKLKKHRTKEKNKANRLIKNSGIERETLASNLQFTKLLKEMDVVVPTKISPRTGKEIPALGVNDPGYQQMVRTYPEHKKLWKARQATKSRIEETRATRILNATHPNGTISVPLTYYAAHTGRFGGSDKLNMQNMPRGSVLRECLIAPESHYIYVADLSNIEARMLAWLSGQIDLLKQFELGEDIYSNFASRIYNETVNKNEHPERRFVGKTAILGLGFGMGARKFESTLKSKNITLEPGEAQKVVATYRASYPHIVNYWKVAESLLNSCMSSTAMGNRSGPIYVGYKRLVLPNTLSIRYKDLHFSQKEGWRYRKRKNWVNIYGGSITENIVQALSRIIITDAMLEIERKFPEYRIVLTVHDEIVVIAKDNEPGTVLNNIIDTMCQSPEWCESLPLAAEGGYAQSYSK